MKASEFKQILKPLITQTIKEVLLEKELLSEAEIDELLDIEKLI